MTLDCSLPSSTACENKELGYKRFPKGIHIVGANDKLASSVEGVSGGEQKTSNSLSIREDSPWGYIFIQHMSAEAFYKKLASGRIEGDFKPQCFIHRSYRYKQKSGGRGVEREIVPSVSGLVFLQGTTRHLQKFLQINFPQYHLVNDCSTGKPASISHCVMVPFMKVLEVNPDRVTFLRDPFLKFAKDHIKLRVLTGPFRGQEGYVVRIDRDRQLVMEFGGYAVAIRGVHNEDFEVAE